MTNAFLSYEFSDDTKSELNNNLTIINEIVRLEELESNPVFYILGGAALVFHDLNYKSTLDIATANRISADIKELISEFIDDAASEVSVLPKNYQERAQKIRNDLDCIEVYILSQEDLLISKLLASRRKDIVAIRTSGILKNVKMSDIEEIISKELMEKHQIMARNTMKLVRG